MRQANLRFLKTRNFALASLGILLGLVLNASARGMQIQDLVRIKGAETSKLVGMGLVVGLNGSGDGGDFKPAMRPLAQVVSKLIDPNVVTSELEDAENVALVALSAELPASGVREGDKVDVHVSTVGPADSLEGGRLFLIPMKGPLPGSPAYAFASGALTIEDEDNPTTGVVDKGAQLTRDVLSRYLDQKGRLQLVINQANASWPVTNNVASLINELMAPDSANIALAADEKNVLVKVPKTVQNNPAGFISQILQTYIDPTQVAGSAKVVINKKTGTIVVTGDVEISPVIISHKGLTITTITPKTPPTPRNPDRKNKRFIKVDPSNKGGTQLADLLAAFNRLKVDAKDRIEIIEVINRSGKLHAKLVIE